MPKDNDNKREEIAKLYYEDNLTQKEIAERLGITQGYVSQVIKEDERYIAHKEEKHKKSLEKKANYNKEYYKTYERPKKEQYIGSFYNENELNELFEKSKDDPLNLMIRIASYYGLRRSEVLGLKWDAFDFDTKTITIKHTVTIGKIDGKRQIYSKDRTKNKSSYRTLPLIDDIAERLLEFKEQQEYFKKAFGKSYYKKDKDYIFVKPDGKLTRPDYVSEHFKILLNKLGLRHIRFHDLRHSCASLLLAKGIPMKAIQEWLGHSNFSTTANIYAHLDSNSKQLSAQVITSAFETKKEIEESDSSNSLEKLALAN